MTLHLSIVADVFTHQAEAQRALEALRQAGFGYDQIGIAMQGHEGIDLLSDLLNLGVPYEDANYYAQQVKAGHTVVSVRPDGREQEAHAIMRRSGASTPDDDTAKSQGSLTDKQRAAWDQAVAAQQVQHSTQVTTDAQDDFHRPRSLKPRAELLPLSTNSIQAEVNDPRPDVVTQQNPSIAPVVQNDVTAPQNPSAAPQNDVARLQNPSVAAIVQSDEVREQNPLTEKHSDTALIDEEDTLRRPTNRKQASVETPTPVYTEKKRNRVLSGVLLGGLLSSLSLGVVFALTRREEIRYLINEGVRRVQQALSR